MEKIRKTAACLLFIVMLVTPSVSYAMVFISDPPAPPQILRAYKTANRNITLKPINTKWKAKAGR